MAVMRSSALLLTMAAGWGVHVAAWAAGTDAGADAGLSEDITNTATALSEVEFSADMLQFPVDVRLFAQANAVPAGTYPVDLYTNGEWKGRSQVRFAMMDGQTRIAQPCFDLALVELLGFDLAHVDTAVIARMQQGEALCQPLPEWIAGAQARYDSGGLELHVSAPQILLHREARGFVDPALWDDGISAGMLDYSYNGYHARAPGVASQSSHYLSLRAGLNLGAWRVRYHANAYQTQVDGFHYHHYGAFVERGIARWNSRLTLGDTVTDGQVFDSLRFRGVRIDSDERMRPDSRRGFAPVVRGIAHTNARVSIRQLGQEIYQTNVPPGAFVIDDLYPTGIGGDLLVTIHEADGREHSFTIAYAGMAALVRPGVTDYTLAAGRYEHAGRVDAPAFVMGNLRRGLNNALTGYTGLMAAEGYSALSAGLAFNLPIGALAADLTYANTRTRGGSFKGSSARVTWAKILPVLGTNVTLASYRYSSQGYFEPSAAFALREQMAHGGRLPGIPAGMGAFVKTRNRLIINASQTLPGQWGAVNIAASSQDYWARDGRDTQYQLGWNRQLQRASLGLSASRTHNVLRQRWDNQYMLNVSLPLGDHGVHANASWVQREDGHALNASVSTLAGAQQQFGLGAFVSGDARDGMSSQYSGGAHMAWDAARAQLGASVSASRGGGRQYGVSLSGGMVAFGGGIILTPRLGDTIGIIEAKDAHRAHLADHGGQVRLNRRGQAVAPYLQPYRQNRVTLDPKGLSTDIAITTTVAQVAPTAGAVVLLRYPTERGYSILLRGRHSDGRHLPYAAVVTDAEGRHVGHIAQGGQALLRVKARQGELSVRWGPGEDEGCRFHYALSDSNHRSKATNDAHDFRHVDAVCMTGGIILAGSQNLDGGQKQ